MRCGNMGWHPCQKPEGHSWLTLPRRRTLCLQQPLSAPSRDTRCMGPVCICFASLGMTLSLTLSLAQMTWCSLTMKPMGFTVVTMRASREMFPGRDLCPLFISASVRNLLGHVVANKKEIPDFNLTHGLWIFACLSCHGCSHFGKSVFQGTGKGWLSLLGPGNVSCKWDQKRQIAQNCLWESAETKLATDLSL